MTIQEILQSLAAELGKWDGQITDLTLDPKTFDLLVSDLGQKVLIGPGTNGPVLDMRTLQLWGHKDYMLIRRGEE